MNLANIINSITGGNATKRTAAELRASLASIDLQALERKVTDIERQRRDLLLSGTDAELLAITQDLSAANLEAERAQALTEELTRLIVGAEAREKIEAIEAGAEKAQAARLRLFGLYEQADAAAKAVLKVVAEIESARAAIREANGRSGTNGRPDLKVADPLFDLVQHVGCHSVEQLPRIEQWHLSGYTGAASDRFQLGHIRELQPAPLHRKAA